MSSHLGPSHGRGNVLVSVTTRAAVASPRAGGSHRNLDRCVDLGQVGTIKVDFVPSGTIKKERPKCGKPVEVEAGSYKGTIDFEGEEGFSKAHATSVPGEAKFVLSLVCGGTLNGGIGGHSPGARLSARGPRGRFEFEAQKNSPSRPARFTASIEERRGSIRIERAIGAKARSRCLRLRRARRGRHRCSARAIRRRGELSPWSRKRAAGTGTSSSISPAVPAYRSPGRAPAPRSSAPCRTRRTHSASPRGANYWMWRLVPRRRAKKAPHRARLARIAERQHGVISFAQLISCGLGRHAITTRVERGSLHRVHRGVYAVGHRRLSPHGRSDGRGPRMSRGVLWSAIAAPPSFGICWSAIQNCVDVSVPGDGGRRRRNGIRLHRSRSLRSHHLTSPSRHPGDHPDENDRGSATSSAGARRAIGAGALFAARRGHSRRPHAQRPRARFPADLSAHRCPFLSQRRLAGPTRFRLARAAVRGRNRRLRYHRGRQAS